MSKLEAARLSWAKKNEPSQGTIALTKVEKILEGSLDSIPTPSVKTRVTGGKVCSRCKGKTLLGQQVFQNNKFVDITQQCFALLTQGNFPAMNLNFH